MVNSLSQLLIKVTTPGIPDFYQGTEIWDFNLVDPDNRRPIKYEDHQRALNDLLETQRRDGTLSLVNQLLQNPSNGQLKLWITTMALQHRRNHPSLFLEGQYLPLEAEGPQSPHVCSFGRIKEGQAAVTIVPRFISNLCPAPEQWPIGTEVWGDTSLCLPTELANSQFKNLLTGETIASSQQSEKATLPLDKILQHFPIALLERAV